jgi:hypothetical protein
MTSLDKGHDEGGAARNRAVWTLGAGSFSTKARSRHLRAWGRSWMERTSALDGHARHAGAGH